MVKKMNKSTLIEAVVASTSLKKKDAEAAVNAVVAAIEKALVAGDKVQVAGLGTFKVKERAAKKGKNPQTQAVITIPACKYPAFTAGKTLKDAVNK